MMGPGPAAGAPVAVAPLPSRGLPRCVQFSVARSVQYSMVKSVIFQWPLTRRRIQLDLCLTSGGKTLPLTLRVLDQTDHVLTTRDGNTD